MNSALAPLACAVPLIGAATVSVIGPRVPRAMVALLSVSCAVFSSVACALLAHQALVGGPVVHWFGGWTPRNGIALGIAFVVDGPGGTLAALAAMLSALALIYAWTFYQQDDGAFNALMLVFTAALIGFFLTGDLFNMFVFFELMSVAAYALTAFRTEDEGAVQGAFTFGAVNSTGALFVLVGVALTYARTGALSMAQIANALGPHGGTLVAVAFALIAAGFLIKAGILPFHFWLIDAHAVAATPVCVLFSGVMVEAGLFGVLRCWWSVFGHALGGSAPAVSGLLVGLGAATALGGALLAYGQRHLKRTLACSTVSHAGALLCSVGLLSATGIGAFLLYTIVHAFLKAGLFLGGGIVLNRYASLDVEALRGKVGELPWLPLLLAAGGWGIAGLPPFGLQNAAAALEAALRERHLVPLGALLTVCAAITGAAVVKDVGRMTFGWGSEPDPAVRAPSGEQRETDVAAGAQLLVMACAAAAGPVLAIAAGTLNGPLLGIAHVRAEPAAPASMLGALAVFALCVTWSWTWPKLGRIGARVTALVRGAIRPLHAWQTGIVCDDIAWVAVGSACIAAVCAFSAF